MDEFYLWLKALHIVAVVTWIGGMLIDAVILAAISDVRDTGYATLLARVRLWDRRVTAPAMIIVWALGMTLVFLGHWFPQTWLLMKLAIVLLLSGLHGALSGQLRRASKSGVPNVTPQSRYMAALVLLAAFLIVVLVVVKPF